MTRRILVVRLDSAGDVLLAGPAVRAVAAGGNHVVFLCSRQGSPAARLLPGVHQVVEWDCPWITATPSSVSYAEIREIREALAGLACDSAVILTSFHQSALPTALLLRMAGIPEISAISQDYPGSLLDFRVQPEVDIAEDIPEPERALAVAAAAGFRLPAGDSGALAVQGIPHHSVLGDLAGYIVMHPGAAVPARAWPPVRCAQAVDELIARGYPVVVTGGPDERALTAFVSHDKGIDLGGKTSFAELARVLANASAVVVGNTGPAHLAAALGTPVVSLFAPVVPAARWRPYRVPHLLLGDQHALCRNSRARICPVAGHPCLSSVTAADVAAAVEQLVTLVEVST